jgi:hypothetical protein
MRTLTVQSGPYSNWIGAHYWSSLEHDSGFPESCYSDLYNETEHGVFEPRLFLVDCSDNLGQINLPEPVEETESVEEALPVHRYDRSVNLSLHPIRQAVIEGLSRPHMPTLIPPPAFWTDFWELKDLPVHRQVLTQNLCLSQYRYWFDLSEQTSDMLDDTPLRSLVEATDSSVHVVRIITDVDSSFSQYGLSCSEYLRSCYPKSRGWNLGCPQIPSMDHLKHDHSMPTIINIAKILHAEITLNDSTRSATECFLLPPPSGSPDKLYDTGFASIWLDSQLSGMPQSEGFSVQSPYLSIDGKTMYSPFHPGSHSSHSRARPYMKNLANPVEVSVDSEISSGSFEQSSLQPFLGTLQPAIARFQRDFRAAWEAAVENDEWIEIKDTVANLL